MRGDPAGFWIRLVSYLIDGAIVFGIGAIIWPILFGETFWVTTTYELSDGSTTQLTSVRSWATPMTMLYSTFFLALYGWTPGKWLMNIRVYDAEGRRRIGFVRAGVRSVAELLSAVLILVGYIIVAFRQDKRALHDLIAGTYPTIRRRTRY